MAYAPSKEAVRRHELKVKDRDVDLYEPPSSLSPTCYVSVEDVCSLIEKKFPEFFNSEGQDYDTLHKLEELGSEIASKFSIQ